MKNSIFILSLLLAFNASAAAEKISIQCEQGVGNRSNPDPIIQVEGKIADINKRGEYTAQEKDLLDISVFTGNLRMEKLNSNEYKLSVVTSGSGMDSAPKMILTILTDRISALSYEITHLEGLGSLVQVEKAAKIAGKRNIADGGMCMGVNPL